MDHPLPWLRYVDASDVQAADLDFDGLKVRNDAFETLGDVEGFVVDRDSLRPYYVVVDSGGWFKSKDFLVPIGHARLDDDRDALVIDIPKERIDRFPGFDRDRFEQLSPEEIRQTNDAICAAASATPVTYASGDPFSAAWNRPDYRQPDWWGAAAVRPDRMGDRAYQSTVAYPPTSGPEATREQERERVTARESEPSPHPGGRAQPGDVLGPETGGERTYIGDTTEDENKRRIDAEREWENRRRD
ncbi:MAG: PRC-barrel domain-containing protein [Vicinamibacterales bacterium]